MTYVIGINKKYLFLDDTDYVKHHGGCGSLKEQNIFVCKLTGKWDQNTELTSLGSAENLYLSPDAKAEKQVLISERI